MSRPAHVIELLHELGWWLDLERTTLAKAGVNVAEIIAPLRVLIDELASIDSQRESLERQLAITTVAHLAVRERFCLAYNQGLDRVMTVVSASTAAGEAILRLKGQISILLKHSSVPNLPSPSPEDRRP